MAISINKEDNIKVNVTETGWVFFKIKGSERMSSYNKLVKNIENMRNIMRDFYIYGIKTWSR